MTSIHADVKSACRRATLMIADVALEDFEAVVRMVLAKHRARRGGV